MEQPPRARGRARGRHPAAEVPNPGQLHREQGRPAPGLRAAGEVPQQYGNQGLHHQLPEGAVGGRATHPLRPDHQGGGDEALSGRMMHMNIRAPSGPGGDAPSRGGIRQGRFLPEFVRTRPEQCGSKKGESGQPEILTANYFQLVKTTDWCLYQYRVDFAPEVDDKRQKKLLLRIHKAEIGGYLFDGTVLFASRRLHPDPMELFSDGPGGQPVKITIRLVGDVDFGDPQYLQVLNILMRRCLGHLRLQLVGRNFFDPHASETVREYNLEVWPGYVTSIRQHETAILMCAEITHKVMRQDTVLNNLNGYVQQNPKDYQLEFKRDILGAVVLTDYNNKTYRVDDVDFNSSPLARFPMKDGQEVSYIDYYRTRYSIEIRNPDQPMLVSRPSARDRRAGQTTLIYLVPELCRMTGLSESMRSNFHLMRGLSAHTRVDPVTRIEKLLQFNQRLSATPEVRQDMTEWNMQLSKDLVHFPGRILQQESILQGEKLKYPAGPDADWTRELRKNPMLAIGVLKEWVVIFPDRFTRETQSFVNNLIKAAAGMSFVMAQPHYHNIPDDRRHTYTNNLENVISAKNPRMILCVVSNNGSDRYSDIKRTCCLKHAVPTQVIVARNLSAKGVLSIATKVAIQMNCKIGGAPWSVEIPLSGLMVVGFDVCHDTSSVRKSSWGAMVASLDKGCSRYFSSVSQHVNHEEICNELSVNLTKALHKYKQYNQGTLPQRIIIYRDGVGEGQLPYVFDHEVEVVRRNLSSLYGGNPVKMAFIVVSKRINTRLFLKGRNPPPGTVADDCITLPERYDFFLVSQSVRQGTVSPTYYNVLYDNLGLSPDKIQRLTYKMTHLYFNWSGTVRVPAPCQYAHKLAFLVGQSLHHPPRNDLEDLLYFL